MSSFASNAADGTNNVPSNTDELYDRQIRLWGASAQSLLLASHVLFVRPKSCVVEALKNTVLSGIKVTICTLGEDNANGLYGGVYFGAARNEAKARSEASRRGIRSSSAARSKATSLEGTFTGRQRPTPILSYNS